jgi:sulfoxide reductase heme-binding subunit YedZ
VFKPSLFVLFLLPCVWLLWRESMGQLGANPIEAMIRELGLWALRLLLLTLCVTPVRQLLQWHALVRVRRMLGLYSFFYAMLHVISYLWLDQSFDISDIFNDIVKRPFITVGFLSFMLLIPLAMTSSNRMIQRLGGKQWRQLHRLVYLIGILSVLHFWWMAESKSRLAEPWLYAIALVVLLALRVPLTRLFLNTSAR